MELEVIDERREALAKFQVTKEAVLALCSEYSALTVTGPDDAAGMAKVRAARQNLREVRLAGERMRKALTEKSLRWNQTVNGAAHELFDPIDPVEAHLEYQEKTAERERVRLVAEAATKAERERKERLDDRMRQVYAASPGVAIVPSEVEHLADEQFSSLLAQVKAQRAAIVKAAEECKVAAAKAAAERADRDAADAIQRRQVEAAEREARRIESERIAEERAALAKLREADEAARVSREREARAAQTKLDAERAAVQAEREAIEAEKAAKLRAQREQEAKERAAAIAPDLEKIGAYCEAIEAVKVPDVFCSAEIREIMTRAVFAIEALRP